MVLRPVSISSEKPFNSASLAERFLNRANRPVWWMVIITEIGRVIINTVSRSGGGYHAYKRLRRICR